MASQSRQPSARWASPAVNPEVLAQPITYAFSGQTAPNRFLKGPMTERLCTWNQDGQDISTRGYPTAEYMNLYSTWAQGRIGMIVGGNMMVRYDAVEAYGNPILVDNHDGRVEKFKEMTDVVHQHGSLIVSQLSHPGRQGGKALNPHPVSASDVQLTTKVMGSEFAQPRALTVEEIQELVRSFGETAALCYQAGYDGVQIHAAHGYLIAQFLSPSTNLRTDQYGGSVENRARFLLEVIAEVQRRVTDPKFIMCVKLNSVEFQDKGLDPADARKICVMLEENRVDFVDLSGGTFESRAFHHVKDSTKKREAYFIEFAEQIRPLLKKTKVYVTGGLRTVSGMVKAVEEGSCDGVGLARPLTAEPYFCKQILEGKITGAIESALPLQFSTPSSGTQLHQIGKGHDLVSDFSNEEEAKLWELENEKEAKRKESILPKVDSSGFAQMKAVYGFDYRV